jgi:hypothetical protein
MSSTPSPFTAHHNLSKKSIDDEDDERLRQNAMLSGAADHNLSPQCSADGL